MTVKRFCGLVLVLAMVSVLADVPSADAAGDLAWAYGWGGISNETSGDVAVDAAGNVYTTGSFSGTVDFDPGPGEVNLTSTGLYADAFLLKMSADGTLLWARRWGGGNRVEGQDLGVDSSGNVYVTGGFTGTVDFNPDPATTLNFTSPNPNATSAFVLKLTAGGAFAWAVSWGSTSPAEGLAIAVDSGFLYVTGYYGGTVDFDPGSGVTVLTAGGWADVFLSKLTAADGSLVWARGWGGTSSEYGEGVGLDALGNVYTAGFFSGTVDFDPDPGSTELISSNGADDAFVSKLDSSGDLVWARTWGGTSYDWLYGTAVDAAGNVYTTGGFYGPADFDPETGTTDLTSAGDTDVFLSKLDSSGSLVWARAWGGSSTDAGTDVWVDGSGSVYTSGYFGSTADFDPGPGTFNLTAYYSDAFVSRLSAGGSFGWAVSWGGTGFDSASGVTLDAAGSIYTTGRFTGTADFDPGPDTFSLSSSGPNDYDVYLSKLTVLDSTPPVLSLPEPMTVEATGPTGAPATFTASATDEDPASPVVTCDPPSGSVFPLGPTTVQCSATDTAGNPGNDSFTITVVDTTPPVITLVGASSLTVAHGSVYADAGATASDLVGGNLTSAIVTINPVDTSSPGTYTVTYNVTDQAGNAAVQVTRTVQVTWAPAPTYWCGGAKATIVGTGGDDRLVGTDGPDVIAGLGGDDTIRALGGDDLVCGGPGNDRIYGGGSDDRLYGGGGDDRLWGGPGNDRLLGGTGVDTVLFSGAIRGVTVNLGLGTARGQGQDSLAGVENLVGSRFADTLVGNRFANTLWGRAGDDTLRGRAGDDHLWGNAGDDSLNGGAGHDILNGGVGSNTCLLGEINTNC